MADIEFNVKVKMEERWVPYFQSLLKYMQSLGEMGHSGHVGFYADGDGDFRPIFDFDIPFEKVLGLDRMQLLEARKEDLPQIKTSVRNIPERFFDAG